MRGKIISCFAAGTFSVCLLYSSISQALRGQSPAAEAAAVWQITPVAIVASEDTEKSPEETTGEQQLFPPENKNDSQDYNSENSVSDGQFSQGGRHGKGGGRRRRRNMDIAPDNNNNTESYSDYGNTQFEEEEEDSALKESSESAIVQQQEEPSGDEPVLQQQEEPSGDVPTLQQFLSKLRCGGCHHNCILLSPRCMKGRSKAENAAIEYQQTYGS
ncbi:hypothetical protein SAMN04487833_1576 [Sarcina sp. DSM 11001]|uniref:hypothetical protein n=1 Tax=Sarcina sp. DSM 11001 TaxID=1798184 RepID=UPI00088AA994|nr:hypothetical protein [Sarcina sp. DSM 11001]SDM05480.1 hypothetical protein SAMN04487833_1576 [Sarcina sp. DSM 11001]